MTLLGMMNVFALRLLRAKVGVGIDSALRNLWQLSFNVECESAKLTNVDAFALSQVVVQVSYKSSPNNKHLRTLFNRLTCDFASRGF